MARYWLASYPKSGNTWFRLFLSALAADSFDINDTAAGTDIASAREPFESRFLFDSALLTPDESDRMRPLLYRDTTVPAAAPILVKAHDAYIRLGDDSPLFGGSAAAAGALVIVRDPRDIAASLAHHHGITLDSAIARLADRDAVLAPPDGRRQPQFRQRLLHWSDHVTSWLDQRDLPVHLLRYEDMLREPTTAFAGALGFAGHDASAERIAAALDRTQFARLQADEAAHGFREASEGARFFRRGTAGGWRDELNDAQIAAIEAAHGATMVRLGYALDTVAPARPAH